MEVLLETDRLILRRFTDADVDNLVELDADPEVTHFITNGEATPREEVETSVLPRDEPELGYRLRRAAWGRGYATEGSRALIDRAFRALGASRVFAETMAVNTASRRVMEKAGLRFARAFHADWPVRIPGDEHGDVEYAITREEWEVDRRPRGAPGET